MKMVLYNKETIGFDPCYVEFKKNFRYTEGEAILKLSVADEFVVYVNGEFVEFYPEHNVVEKFFLATEEIHRLNGGRWQDFKFEK